MSGVVARMLHGTEIVGNACKHINHATRVIKSGNIEWNRLCDSGCAGSHEQGVGPLTGRCAAQVASGRAISLRVANEDYLDHSDRCRICIQDPKSKSGMHERFNSAITVQATVQAT